MTDRVVFSFADINPVTGAPYSRSCFRDLPSVAKVAVTVGLVLRPGEWDVLVCEEETDEHIGPDQRWELLPAEIAAAEAAGWDEDDTVAVIGW